MEQKYLLGFCLQKSNKSLKFLEKQAENELLVKLYPLFILRGTKPIWISF